MTNKELLLNLIWRRLSTNPTDDMREFYIEVKSDTYDEKMMNIFIEDYFGEMQEEIDRLRGNILETQKKLGEDKIWIEEAKSKEERHGI